jgi:NAD(P)H-nitrite reductase large subunit
MARKSKKAGGDERADMYVCRCCEVAEAEVLDAIRNGAEDVDAVKRATRAGMGLCQGRSCSHLVSQLIRRETGKAPNDIRPATCRPPIRPIPAGRLAEPL